MTYGFLAAGLTNILGILLPSRGLTSAYFGELFPGVFGRFGCVGVILWGLAYIAVARKPGEVPALLAVFALEKAAYFASWLVWLSRHGGELGAVFGRDALAGAFYAGYGLVDLGFGLFFAWAAWRLRPTSAPPGSR